MSDKLLPCPFCGGPAGFEPNGRSPGYWVQCRDCHTSTGDRSDHDAAASAWNTRSNPSHAQLAAARSALEEARFLLARLEEYDPEDDEHARDFYGHVVPSISRLTGLLSTLAQEPAGQSEAKPVAYIIKDDPELGDYLTWSKQAAEHSDRGYTPLYAHPAVPSGSASPGGTGDVATMRDALGVIARTTFSGNEMGDEYRRGNEDAHQTCRRLALAALAAHPTVKVSGDAAWPSEDEIAETLWHAEYRRATGKERSIKWNEVLSEHQERYRHSARAIRALLLTPEGR